MMAQWMATYPDVQLISWYTDELPAELLRSLHELRLRNRMHSFRKLTNSLSCAALRPNSYRDAGSASKCVF